MGPRALSALVEEQLQACQFLAAISDRRKYSSSHFFCPPELYMPLSLAAGFSQPPSRYRRDRPLQRISIDVALVAFIAFQFLNVFVRLLFALAALFLNDFPQRGIDILGHAPGIAADEKMSAFAIHPFPNLRCTVQHFMLHVGFVCLIARPGAIEGSNYSIALKLGQLFFVEIVAVFVLRSEEKPILSFSSDCFPLLQIGTERRNTGSWS